MPERVGNQVSEKVSQNASGRVKNIVSEEMREKTIKSGKR